MMKLWCALIAGALVFGTVDAQAKRMGGGKSFGQQSGNVTQRQATPQAPVAPANSTANAAKPAPATPAAAPARKPWGAMLGGLAAGLGLAWLAHSLGMGAAFGQFLLIALLVMAALAVFGMVSRSRRNASTAGPFAFQGAGAGGPAAAQAPPQYSPAQVGNDASARPWERNSMAFDPKAVAPQDRGVVIGSALQGGAGALSGPQGWGIPADFDAAGFLAAAKRNFTTLQDAWDRSDIPRLSAMMTDSMVSEIQTQLAEREKHQAGPNKTDVVMLDAQLLGIEDLGEDYMASVEFSGMIREEPSAGPSPFREVWNMTKPKDGRSGWLVAGVQALQ